MGMFPKEGIFMFNVISIANKVYQLHTNSQALNTKNKNKKWASSEDRLMLETSPEVIILRYLGNRNITAC